MTYSKCFPAWGPYGKKYMGISRIADHEFADGVRFDFTAAPAIFGGDIKVPNVTLPSGCHPWECSPDYSFFSYRYDLEWKDRVYADVSYSRLDDESVLVRTEIVNNSTVIQNCLINFFSSVEYPDPRYCRLSLPAKNVYTDALCYDSYDYNTVRPWDRQNPDGLKKGEIRDNRFVSGGGLGDRVPKWHLPDGIYKQFGCEKNDRVSYKLTLPEDYKDACLTVRYRTTGVQYASFTINEKISVLFEKSDELALKTITLGEIKKGEHSLNFVSEGRGGIELDFLCITEKDDVASIKAESISYDYMPETSESACSDGGSLSSCKYTGVDGTFYLRTFNDNTRYRNIETGSLEDCMSARLSNSDPTFDDVLESFTASFKRKHSDDGFFHNTIVHTLFIEPGQAHVEYAVLSKGPYNYKNAEEYERIYESRKAEAVQPGLNAAGEKYELSDRILFSTLLTNAVYPIYKHGENIVHHTPGKRWDCLYTWDSGFIGLGMTCLSEDFARYSLTTYLSDAENPDYAFLHHGSPVPTQMYLYLELINRCKDKESLYKLYPRAKHYYDFMAGKVCGSTTAKLKSGLTTTYDYFYSSSGMDDYPAQVGMIKQDIRQTTAPVISSSQVIRCAKVLTMVASKLGLPDDVDTYKNDIERLTAALNKYSWDPESGYYSYVLHDENMNPTGIFRTSDGENFNKGLDGIYPIIAGVCNEQQKNAILSHLKNEKEMLCKYGISAVDMTAGYFMVNGYWNGNVWFPHQWFIWKSMLDLGESDFAFEIANRALEIWKREVDYSYYTFEMVSVVTGRGGWFHNFGGLSSPICLWARSYYKPGTLSCGLDCLIDSCDFSDENHRLKAALTHFGESDKFTLIAVMNDDRSDYRATVNGKAQEIVMRAPGTLEINISPADAKAFTIEIS